MFKKHFLPKSYIIIPIFLTLVTNALVNPSFGLWDKLLDGYFKYAHAAISFETPITFTGSNDITSAKFTDSASASYYLDPASSSYALLVNGNVGIGTTTPGYKLEVSGTEYVSGALTTGSYIYSPSYLQTPTLYITGNYNLLNKASSGWLAFATRNTSASEAVYDLTNVGTLSASGNITLSGVIKGNVIGARVTHTGNLTATQNAWTNITFNDESTAPNFDTDSMHSTVSNTDRITINTAGKYIVSGHQEAASCNGNLCQIAIARNGTIYTYNNPGSDGNAQVMSIATILDLAATDYLQMQWYTNLAGNTLYGGSAWNNHFSAVRINGADLAEYYPSQDTSVDHGDLVTASPTGKGEIVKTTSPYQKAMGIISTNPAMVLGNPQELNSRLVGLAGRLTVKTVVRNKSVLPGDSLSSSDVPGIAMPMTQTGFSVAQALEEFNPSKLKCIDVPNLESIKWKDDYGLTYGGSCYRLPDGSSVAKVMVMINNSWQDTDLKLTSTKDLSLKNDSGNYYLQNEEKNIINRISALAELIVAKIQAGLIETKKLMVDGIDILKKLNELIVKVDSQQKQIEELKKSIEDLK